MLSPDRREVPANTLAPMAEPEVIALSSGDEEKCRPSNNLGEMTPAFEAKPKPNVGNGLKLTARKSTSCSFTPLKRRITPVLVTLDSDEETPPPSKMSKPDDDKASKNGGSFLAAAVEGILLACGNKVTSVEHEKIRHKLDRRLERIHRDYQGSNRLKNFLSSRAESIRSNPTKVFGYLKEVLDEMHKHAAAKKEEGEPAPETSQPSAGGSGSVNVISSGSSPRRRKHIKKLEKALKACAEEIRRCEAQELSLDDMDREDSTYIRTTRYQDRYMKIYRKIAKLKNLTPSLGRKVDLKVKIESSSSLTVNREVDTFVNGRRGKHQIPDFHDVLNFYRKANEVERLGLTDEMARHEAKETFQMVGKNLRERRLHDLHDNLDGYLCSDHLGEAKDLAEESAELKEVLDRQFKEGREKINRVIDEFAKKQVEAKEEPDGVPDDEPLDDTEAEDEEADDEEANGVANGQA